MFFSPKTTWRQLFESQNPFDLEAKHIFGYQFKAASFVTNELIGPAVFFRMEMDPIRVTYYTEQAWNGEKLILVYPWGVCCVFLGKGFGWAAYSLRQKQLLIILKSWFWAAWQDTKKWHLYNQSDQADSCLTTFPCLGKISKSNAVCCNTNTTHSSMFVQVPWRQFLVNLCAVVGGCFAKLASTSPQNWHFGSPQKKLVVKKPWHFQWLWVLSHIFCHGKLGLEMSWRLGAGVYSSRWAEADLKLSTLPESNNIAPENKPPPPRKRSSSNHPSSGTQCYIVSGRGYAVRFCRKRWESFESLDWSLPRMSNMLLKIVDAIME